MKQKTKKPDLFRSLKLHFILNASFLSAGVILVAFSLIYVVLSNSYDTRRPVEINLKFRNFEFQQLILPNDSQSSDSQSNNNSQNGSQDSSETVALSDDLTEQIQDAFEDRIRADREKSLETLLLTLILTGIGIETVVVIASSIAAENSIRPVKKAYETQKDFISNASHELKTPLAVIQANLEAADIQGNQWIDNAMQKVEEATELNTSLLTLARMDQIAVEPAKKSSVNLEKLVKKTTGFYQPKLDEKGIALEIFGSSAASLPLVRADLTQLLNILLDNAVKYADRSIKIALEKSTLAITNDGATISEEKLPHIFERFYQTDKSKPGVGLGLSIAKTIADRNNWKLTATSDAKTTAFTLKLA